MQMARMTASTNKWPSTNQPIVCPECHPALADPLHNAQCTKRMVHQRPKSRFPSSASQCGSKSCAPTGFECTHTPRCQLALPTPLPSLQSARPPSEMAWVPRGCSKEVGRRLPRDHGGQSHRQAGRVSQEPPPPSLASFLSLLWLPLAFGGLVLQGRTPVSGDARCSVKNTCMIFACMFSCAVGLVRTTGAK